MNLSGKIIWITGASSGIGKALLHECIVRGATVIASSNQISELETVIASEGENGERIISAPFDLSDTSGIEEIVEAVIRKTGSIDYLINLGGVSQRALISETPLWLDRKIMEINYFENHGHILVTSSISGRFGFPLRSAYSASKQALHGFIETLHLENRSYNIRGSAIIPGRVKTNISVNALTGKGLAHGKMDDGQAGGLTPAAAAIKILNGIKRNKREILVGKSELIMLYIRRFFPWLFFRIAGKIKST